MASRSTSPLTAQLESEMPLATEALSLASCKHIGLVIIDEVVGFCSVGGGSLAPVMEDAQISRMVEETNRLAKVFSTKSWPILAFLDTHEPDIPEPPYPPHCIRGTGEENFVPQLEWLEKDACCTMIRKNCINGFVGAIGPDGSNAVVEWISRHAVEQLLVVGICTDICVTDFVVTMLSARNHQMFPGLTDVFVYSDGCSTYNLPRSIAEQIGRGSYAAHPQDATHYMGLYVMSSRGARLVSSAVE